MSCGQPLCTIVGVELRHTNQHTHAYDSAHGVAKRNGCRFLASQYIFAFHQYLHCLGCIAYYEQLMSAVMLSALLQHLRWRQWRRGPVAVHSIENLIDEMSVWDRIAGQIIWTLKFNLVSVLHPPSPPPPHTHAQTHVWCSGYERGQCIKFDENWFQYFMLSPQHVGHIATQTKCHFTIVSSIN